jgi:segregation and condensation protein A
MNEITAKLHGQPFLTMPQDLYIPPEALEVILETFEGPLDLLLYLIRRENLDILNIPIAEITRQYMEYVELMKDFHLELAAEYLVMAAILAEIKSKMLLPRPNQSEASEELDPRAELIRRLLEYERAKLGAKALDELPQQGRDVFPIEIEVPSTDEVQKPVAQVDLKELLLAFKDVLQRHRLVAKHQIQREPLSIRERMSQVLAGLKPDQFSDFSSFFTLTEGRMGVVVTFIAILELMRQSLIEIVQAAPFNPIHIRAVNT